MPIRPNLFNYATSELSQDAFICWLLDWANPKFENLDGELHECGQNLLRALLDEKSPSAIKTVSVRKQDNQIDVLCIVNNELAIIIEDKTNTAEHSGQLNNYSKKVQERGTFRPENIVRIYFKTGDQCQCSYEKIKEKRYRPFLRSDFLKILNRCDSLNQIFLDYRDHLQRIDDDVESYKTLPPKDWKPRSAAWIGFYKALQEELDECEWDYVANPSGGFFGLWWNFVESENCRVYLQLEERKLCFKIEVAGEYRDKRPLLRNHWHNEIMSRAKAHDLSLKKPERFGIGTWMTVCVYDGDYIQSNDGVVSIENTVRVLRRAEKIIDSFMQIVG